MKRIISLVLVLILCLGTLASCEWPWNKEPEQPDGPTYDLTNAKGYLKDLYPNLLPTKDVAVPDTFADYNVTKVLNLKDGKYTVEWTTNVESVEVVDYVPSSDKDILNGDNTSTVKVPARPTIGSPDLTYTLTATITAPDGTKDTLEFNLKVPAEAVNTYEQYVNADTDALLTHEGIITGITKKSDGWTANNVYFQDNDGGYYVYNLKDEQLEGLAVGMKIQVTGKKAVYNGTWELVDASIKVLDSTINPVTPTDYTEKLAKATKDEDLKAAELIYAQSFLVTIKGVTILEAGDNGYYYFQLGNGPKVYLRVSSSNNPCSKKDTEDLIATHAANYGNKADVTGLVTLYSGKFYLTPVSADAFHNIQEVEKAPEQQVVIELDQLEIKDSYYDNGEYTLPTAGTTYSDIVISWASNSNSVVVGENGKITITIPDTDTEVKLTATATLGEATATKDFTIKLYAPVEGQILINSDRLGLGDYADGTVTLDGIEFEYTQIGDYGNGIQVKDKDGKTSMLWNNTAFEAPIAKIILVYSSSMSVYTNADCDIFYFGNSASELSASVKLSTTAGTTTYEIVPDAQTYTFFKFEHDLSYTGYWESFTIVLTNGVVVTPPAGDDDNTGTTPPATGNYVQVTSAEAFTSGTYVLVVNGGYGLGHVDGSWITKTEDMSESWTLEVSGSTVTFKDKNGVYIAPKSGNNSSNGLATDSYAWTWSFENGTFTFSGTGNDTNVLAFNSDAQYMKFRSYKLSTVTGQNAATYPSSFTLYKLA